MEIKQSVFIKADKGRNIRLTTNALAKAEEIIGKPISNFGDNMGFREIRTVLYCGLYWEDKELTEEKTGDIMDIIIENNGFGYLGEKVQEALSHALGKTEVLEVKHPAQK